MKAELPAVASLDTIAKRLVKVFPAGVSHRNYCVRDSAVRSVKKGVTKSAEAILVTYPNGHTRSLAPGPGAVLSKAVIEDFAPRYLRNPAVLRLSESASKVRECARELAASLALNIDAKKDLPDVILVDAGRASAEFLVLFVEVVATDGPVSEERRRALLAIAESAGFERTAIAFLSVFVDRSDRAFKKAVADLALGSLTWFMAVPDSLMVLRDGKPVPPASLRA